MYFYPLRTCEYDEEELEYWVNTRTEGTLTQEEVEELCRAKEFSGEGGTDLEHEGRIDLEGGFSFDPNDSFIHRGSKNVEGDHVKSAASIEKLIS